MLFLLQIMIVNAENSSDEDFYCVPRSTEC